MTESAGGVETRSDGAVLSVSTAREDERLRELIRAELDRHYALPVARRTLELMAEAAAEPASGEPGYRIVDRNGETRLRPAKAETSAKPDKAKKKPRKGEAPAPEAEAPSVPMSLSELVEELRERHSDLFGTPPPEPEPAPPPEQHAAIGETVAQMRAAGAKFVGTQTALARSFAGSFAGRSAERGRALAAAAGGTVGGWRHRLDERLKAHRAAIPDDASPAPPQPSQGKAAPAGPPAAPGAPASAPLSEQVSGQASATQARRDWRALGRDVLLRLKTMRPRRGPEEAAPAAARIAVPSLRDVAGDLYRRRLAVAGLGFAAVLLVILAGTMLVRQYAGTAPNQGGAVDSAAQESPAPENPAKGKPAQQAESAPPAAREPVPAPQAAAPAAPQAAPQADPEEQPDEPQRRAPDEIVGVPEVIDTATLRVSGTLVRLFGVEWVRGGQAEELAKYLAGRAVRCRPATGSSAYLCSVAGRDLSEVVLFNGGGRASSEATPDLVAAEDRARSERLGVWKR